jgi:hypothetical protein
MSYLDRLRLVFYGDFQADVSTVNNDVRHFDTATFEPRFQQVNQGPVENGWWHPTGSNAFRLIDCRIRAASRADGTMTADAAAEPVVGMRIGGSTDRVSGKLVDLDPQWQLASEIWGLTISIVDNEGMPLVSGLFDPVAFRDIQFGRQLGAAAINGQGASSRFQSRLTGLTWASDDLLARSPLLVALKAASATSLSVRLTTFGYFTRADRPRFTLGTISGVIGPVRDDDEPRSFILGRRFAPQNGDRTIDGLNFFDALLDVQGRAALVDLSNAIPLTDPFGAQRDVGSIDLVALTDDGISEGQAVSAGEVVTLATDLPYRAPQWLANTGGIHAAPLGGQQLQAAGGQPWALIVRPPGGQARVLIRETRGGFHVRCEPFVQRVDAGSDTHVEIRAALFGAPFEGEVLISAVGRMSGQGGGNPNAPQQPAAPLPDINVPADTLRFTSSVRLDANGRGTLTIQTQALGEPRGYLDGQIYLLRYVLADAPALVQHQFDFIVLHVRSTYAAPGEPAWSTDIAPILSQYGNLYPVMSHHIVDLSSYEQVRENRAILTLAFSLPIEDPNYMPVTRDLSAAKLRTLLAWLNERDGAGEYVLRREPRETRRLTPRAEGLARAAAAEAEAGPAKGDTALARRVAEAQRAKGQPDPSTPE